MELPQENWYTLPVWAAMHDKGFRMAELVKVGVLYLKGLRQKPCHPVLHICLWLATYVRILQQKASPPAQQM